MTTPKKKRISEELGRLLREAYGTQQSERWVADKTGISGTALGNWGKGNIPTDPDDLRRIADVCGVLRRPLLEAAGFYVSGDDAAHDEQLASGAGYFKELNLRGWVLEETLRRPLAHERPRGKRGPYRKKEG